MKTLFGVLEGYFVLLRDGRYKLKDGTIGNFTTFFPRFIIKREDMSSFEKKLTGFFQPFEEK